MDVAGGIQSGSIPLLASHACGRGIIWGILLGLRDLDGGQGRKEDVSVEGIAVLGVGYEDDEVCQAAVVAGDGGGSKLAQAEKLGVAIVSEERFEELSAGSGRLL